MVYVEGGGAGGYYALQYARVFFPRPQRYFALSLGLSSYHFRDFNNDIKPDLIFPLGLHFFYGIQHQFHGAIGHTVTSIVKADGASFQAKREWTHHGYLLLGYRFCKKNSAWFFDGSYSPLLERYRDYRHWGRVAVGRFF
jgi:hypothetical protein